MVDGKAYDWKGIEKTKEGGLYFDEGDFTNVATR
jgi:hypothetical protein